MKSVTRIGIIFSLTFILGGCGIGYNKALFLTKSNIGIDIETTPPTAEISIARREGVIAPSFEGGQTPPVLAGFGSNLNTAGRFVFGVDSTFAGGDAAVALSQGPGGPKNIHESRLCLSEVPEEKALLGIIDVSIPKPGEVRPFIFGTDTTLGFKVAWSERQHNTLTH